MGILIAYLFGIVTAISSRLQTKPINSQKEINAEQRAGGAPKETAPIVTSKLRVPESVSHQHYADKKSRKVPPWITFVVNVLTLLAVVWYACEARKQRIAMDNTYDEVKKQTTTAHDSLVLGNRPWVHEKNFHIAKPLEFAVNGEASIVISGTLENLGHSPALQARSNSFLIAITMTKFVNEEIAEKQDTLCNPLRTQSSQLLDTAIFPGDLIPVQEGIGLSQKDIQAAAKARSSGPFRREGYISLAVITCVDYQMSFLSEHHQTRYAFQLGIPKGGAFMGDVKPEGVQPEVQLIYFSESAD